MPEKIADDLILRFYEPERLETVTIPATVLAQSLEAMQRLVYITAMRREGRSPGRRIRPSTDIQDRYRLICAIPDRGSYLAPVRIQPSDLLSSAETVFVMDEITALFQVVDLGDGGRFNAVLPDSTWRGFVLEALERVIPARGSGVELEIRRNGLDLLHTVKARGFVERLARDNSRKLVHGSVVGELKRIDFAKHELTIRHAETGRDLSCVYEPHVEQSLLEHPRDMLLVHGAVTRDSEGRPLSIEDVDHIELVDLTPLAVGRFIHGNTVVEPVEQIAAKVTFNETEAVYVAEIPDLTVSVFAETREILMSALDGEISLLWRRYAMAEDARLTRAASALKQRVLERFRSLPHAA